MMDKDTFIEIAGKIADGTASEREIALYNAYYTAYQLKYPLWNELTEEQRNAMLDEAEEGIHIQLRHDDDKKTVKLWRGFRIKSGMTALITAAAVAAVVLGVWFYEVASSRKAPRNDGTVDVVVNDIAPGKNGATITLSNGKVIELSSAKSGVVIGNGKIAYYSSLRGGDPSLRSGQAAQPDDEIASIPRNDDQQNPSSLREPVPTSREGTTKQPPLELTASTARGQTYQFTLPDGTRVWLNADSKISFPSQFSGEERKILLEGEGYFEVAKLMGRSGKGRVPFKVESKGQTVEVLGTHFNINAYKDEIVTTTTLLEGSVRVAAFNSATGRETIMLKPNQQSILNANGTQVLNVDVNTVVGWKNGLFTYKNTPLSIVMRQIERWYNVSVAYENNDNRLKERLLSGSVSRYDNVSGILKAIELTGTVKFKVKDKTITVYQQ